MTKKHSGGFTAVLVIIIAIALVGASGYLAAEMMKNKSSAKGDSAFENGRYEEAFEYYKEADKYSLRPDAKIVKGLAKSAFKSGNTEEAHKNYKKLIVMEPNDKETRYSYAQLCIKQEEYKTAEEQVRALRAMQDGKASEYADELTGQIQTARFKGVFSDQLKKISPAITGGIIDGD